jgi:hypothetical protein
MVGFGSVARMDVGRRRASASESYYDNHGFTRGSSVSSQLPIIDDNSPYNLEEGQEAEGEEVANLDEESFRSDLERDSAHSSIDNRKWPSEAATVEPASGDRLYPGAEFRRMSHEQRYEELQRQSNIRASMELQQRKLPPISLPRYPILDTAQIQLRLQQEKALRSEDPKSAAAKVRGQRVRRPRSPPPVHATTQPVGASHLQPLPPRPEPRLSNLFGVVDTRKLKTLFGNYEVEVGRGGLYNLDPIPEASAPPASEDEGQPTRRPSVDDAKWNPFHTHGIINFLDIGDPQPAIAIYIYIYIYIIFFGWGSGLGLIDLLLYGWRQKRSDGEGGGRHYL